MLASALVPPLAAQHPNVSAIYPRGSRQGSEVELKIYGDRLQSIEGLTFFQPGISVLEVKPKTPKLAEVRIQIAKDCPLGSHPLLVRTGRGFSKLHLFFVGTLREVSEKEPNDSTTKCRAIELESTVNGRIKPEDVDVFAIDVKKGQRINIEVQGLRLGDDEFDPHLTVEDEHGKRLAIVDDTILGHLDPITALDCTKSGRWYITLRENARGGTNNSFYRLHIGTFPRPLAVFPAGGKPGQQIKVRYLNDTGHFDGLMEIPASGIKKHFVSTNKGTSPTPLHIVSSSRNNLFESDKAKQAATSLISSWSAIGPFVNPRNKKGQSLGQQTRYPPEQGYKAGTKHKGRDGEVQWQPKSLADNVTHDLRKVFKKPDNSVIYLHRSINTSSARRVLCILRGNDTLNAWCNGKPVANTNKNDEQRIILDLEKGPNSLLVKISNRSGSMNFYCRVLDSHRLKDHRVFQSPVALNGIIEHPGVLDRYVFLAKAKEAIDFRVLGRRLRSPIDSTASIYCTHQSFYVGNDDSGGLDSLVKFRAPFTGEFVFRVGDTLQTASPQHVYRVEVSKPQTPSLITRSSFPGYQYEWCVNVPRGSRNAMMISTTNLDRQAGTQLSIPNLPAGVQATIPPFAKGAVSVPVVFTVAAQTKTQSSLLVVDAKASVKGRKVENEQFQQSVVIVESRNRSRYLSSEINKLPLAVTKASPFSISVPKVPVPLIRNSSISIPVDIQWAKDFKGSARIRMLYNPPGITAGQIEVKPGQKRVNLSIYANGSVATDVHKIVLVAMGSVEGANISSSSEIVDLEVNRPWIEASVSKTRSTPGTNVNLDIQITRPKKHSGKIEAQWIGVPRDIDCGAVTIQADTSKLTIPVKIGPKAPPGRHRGFRLRIKLHTDKGVVTHDFRSGEIRVDRPVTTEKQTP